MKLIQVSQWLLSGEEHEPGALFLVEYSAEWCSSCVRIFPTVSGVMNGHELLGRSEVPASERPGFVKKIPFFTVMDGRRNVLGSLQTSREQAFREFMAGFGVVEKKEGEKEEGEEGVEEERGG